MEISKTIYSDVNTRYKYIIIILMASFFSVLLSSCVPVAKPDCPAGTQNLSDCPPLSAVNDEKINKIYKMRTWLPESELTIDPIAMGAEAKIPINNAEVKILGPSFDSALDSLAAKIWMVENAQHTVDASYYIFKQDLIGDALLGAMCNAVKRGVDVRLMVDSIGSFSPGHNELKALETCAEHAGFMRNEQGQLTTKKARVQVVIFNAITKFQFNRRSHDKLLIIDGAFPDTALVMIGGRNISLHYYGIHEDGSRDENTFRDVEILVKPGKQARDEEHTLGDVSEIYYSLLFLHNGNRRIWPEEAEDDFNEGKYDDIYITQRKKAQQSLAALKSLPAVKNHLQQMSTFMKTGFYDSNVRLTHQLSNLTNENVTVDVEENLKRNPNSIIYLIKLVFDEARARGVNSGTLRIISPYLFSGKFRNEDGEIIYDGTRETLAWLDAHPEYRLEVITNSVLTGDNVFTQAIIDIDMAPGYLLTPELKKAWQSADLEQSEFNPNLVGSEQWKRLINHPQVFIYQTGKIDSVILGGKKYYGKLHAKYIVGEGLAFVGTSNFDYRSNLYNNEMGFFIQNEGVRKNLIDIFEDLKSKSYRWGTPEWLEMRKKLMQSDSLKAGPAEAQRSIYKTIRFWGLEYLM